MAWIRVPLAWLAAVVGMAATGVVVQTQFVLGALADVGADITLADRMEMTVDDLAGFGPTYAVFIAIGFAIAFFAGWLVIRYARLPRPLVHAVAGAACMGLMLVLMEQVFFGVPVIAGARSAAGFSAQAALGALWGFIYAGLSGTRR
ncbi:hypothetical protein E5163_05475 [Marinicauda algicola]|uniref:Uncharacterized protein n=1 Tax=Marinicauda algicola TaxID=2029849 RepID=A0A4S2H573_9PROT|nr:hypothetical protein [Marinicauda algicola]TGY90571.1 hypothetical protein E5163_05475 [Marinicauda algicola]